METESTRLRIRVAPERIHFLKFILEGYDGLAIVTTVDRETGLLELRYSLHEEKFVLCLLDDLAPAVRLDPFTFRKCNQL